MHYPTSYCPTSCSPLPRSGSVSFILVVLGLFLTLHADPAAGQDAFFVDATGETPTYYSLEHNRPVPAAVSDTGGWDLAFKGSEIRVNGSARFVDAAFDSLATAPSDGYATDTAEEPALPGGSGKGWFNYNPATHEVTPVENRTILLKRAGGGYAKIEITDYYKQEFTSEGPRPVPRFYSFRFALSDTGTW